MKYHIILPLFSYLKYIISKKNVKKFGMIESAWIKCCLCVIFLIAIQFTILNNYYVIAKPLDVGCNPNLIR